MRWLDYNDLPAASLQLFVSLGKKRDVSTHYCNYPVLSCLTQVVMWMQEGCICIFVILQESILYSNYFYWRPVSFIEI